MFKDDLASFSLTKIICISIIIIFCSAACVLAFSNQPEVAEIATDVEYKNTVLNENEDIAIQDTLLNITEKLEAVVEETETETITKTYKVKYIDGQEVERQEASSNSVPKIVAKAPAPKKVTSRSAVTRTEPAATNSGSGYIKFTATGYCACSKCCGKYSNGYTASGDKAQAGITVAMSGKYAFGTQVEIKGMGTYTVQDRGSAIQGNKIDIYFGTHQEALNFGRRTVEVSIP